MGKIVAFLNQKGGVGKTTTCVNMAGYLAQMGKKVLLLDIDPQGNASSNLGIEKDSKPKTIYNVIVDDNTIDEVIVPTKLENLDLIPSDVDLAGAEIELVQMNNREKVVRNILKKVVNNYDYICIDCPPSLGLITVNALTACDSVLIPIQCEYFALEGLSQLMYTIKLVKKHLNENIDVEGVVLTMKDNRSNLGQSVAQDITKYFGKKVYKTIIPRNIRLAEAPSFGEPICVYDPKCTGAIAYRTLTEEFLKNNE
ncbi:MAG: AAA family ATPase [Firmicutes bacterium]|nr:AAA family ATPase [Bacillota bacterium]MDY5676415.1 AAA family ATPase [Eubacteriales bacterium]